MDGLSPAQVGMHEHKVKASWLMMELINEGYDLGELIGQMLASYSESGAGLGEAIAAGAAAFTRFAELLDQPQHIWEDLVPGAGRPPLWMVIEIKTLEDIKQQVKDLEERVAQRVIGIEVGQFGENVVLAYGLDYHHGEDVYHCPTGAKFFTDEQGHQWVAFVPTNGGNSGREHMFRVVPTADYVVRRT